MTEVDIEREFWILITIQMVFAGISFYIQSLFQFQSDTYLVIRATRMIIGYVLPVLWFYRRHSISLKKLGVIPPSPRTALNFLAGVMLYILAGFVFTRYEIFFDQWRRPLNPFVVFPTIFILVAVTDFWTRGFILQFLAEHRDKTVAIVTQNAIWFIIHWYEILLLQDYIGISGAIILTLFLGIGGDLLTLRSKEITGLMLGHFILNLMIITYANTGVPEVLEAVLSSIFP